MCNLQLVLKQYLKNCIWQPIFSNNNTLTDNFYPLNQLFSTEMSCLLANLESDPKSMARECVNMLQRRKDLWEYAAQVIRFFFLMI